MGTIKSEVAFQTTSASRVKFVRIFVFVVAGMAGLLFGLDQGVISGALPFIAKEWELTSRLQEWVVSSMMVGAAIGAIIASKLSSGIGRKEAGNKRGSFKKKKKEEKKKKKQINAKERESASGIRK